MIAQYIQLGNRDWNVLVYYGVSKDDFYEIADSLLLLDFPKDKLKKTLKVLSRKNTGLTFSNSDYKMSIVCIADATNLGLFINTAIHEAKHVQSHICLYYNVEEDDEAAAYLIGHLVQRMYKMFAKFI